MRPGVGGYVAGKDKKRSAVAQAQTGGPYYDHSELEAAILSYQASLCDGDTGSQQRAFDKICAIYQPRDYISKWYGHYKHLYDSTEDFEQDYMRVFCTTLAAWKPRHLRKPSRYGGKGHFQNFFWGALSHAYINGVKSEAAAKRNIPQQCPLCHEWCNPLSTHLLNHHTDLLWERLDEMGYSLHNLTGCPFCRSFKTPKKQETEDLTDHHLRVANSLRKHIVSMHSSVLFETFHDKYPDHVTVSARPVSVHAQDSHTGEDTSAYDTFESRPGIDGLMALNLTPIQRLIVERILNDGLMCVAFDATYGCTEDEFAMELDGLQDAMVIAGLEASV
ncbi:MAG: hypothetical protein JSS66_05275 [Armatimonadetes bacterium]|nr:hypothetical protein [Armatimonadota bacterium]